MPVSVLTARDTVNDQAKVGSITQGVTKKLHNYLSLDISRGARFTPAHLRKCAQILHVKHDPDSSVLQWRDEAGHSEEGDLLSPEVRERWQGSWFLRKTGGRYECDLRGGAKKGQGSV